MRSEPTVLHIDLDAFYAAVEQRDKPSLRGKPVVVGGVGGRGVVATASYEARVFGVRSAMPTREARSRCPHAAFLAGRHHVYREVSRQVLAVLHDLSPVVEPLSLDEAFVDLAVAGLPEVSPARVTAAARTLKERVHDVTGGLTASVGVGTSKLVAKIASDLRKPDGLVVVEPGDERALLDPLPVTRIPGVGPATAERLRRVGVLVVRDLAEHPVEDLVALLGQAHGRALRQLARAEDDRAVVAEREAKSVSVEDTYDVDVADPRVLDGLVERQARKVADRLRRQRLSGRTITLKVRLHDFTTHTRSLTLTSPTDDAARIVSHARRLLGQVDTTSGARLLGVGVSGLADWIQDDLFSELPEQPELSDQPAQHQRVDPTRSADPAAHPTGDAAVAAQAGEGDRAAAADAAGGDLGEAVAGDLGRDLRTSRSGWWPGMDVLHASLGQGWVWGAGAGRVTVRFETSDSGPGPVRTFLVSDPALTPLTALPGRGATPR